MSQKYVLHIVDLGQSYKTNFFKPVCSKLVAKNIWVFHWTRLIQSVATQTVPNCTVRDAAPVYMHTVTKQAAARQEDWRRSNVRTFSTKLKPCQVISDLSCVPWCYLSLDWNNGGCLLVLNSWYSISAVTFSICLSVCLSVCLSNNNYDSRI